MPWLTSQFAISSGQFDRNTVYCMPIDHPRVGMTVGPSHRAVRTSRGAARTEISVIPGSCHRRDPV